MLEQGAGVLPDVQARVISLLLMALFLLLGVAWGVAVSAELKSGSTMLTGRATPVNRTAVVPQSGVGQR